MIDEPDMAPLLDQIDKDQEEINMLKEKIEHLSGHIDCLRKQRARIQEILVEGG